MIYFTAAGLTGCAFFAGFFTGACAAAGPTTVWGIRLAPAVANPPAEGAATEAGAATLFAASWWAW